MGLSGHSYGGVWAPESLDTRRCSLSIIDVDEFDGVFCSRREEGFLDGVPVIESREELLRDRRALDRRRGFLLSALSGSSLGENSLCPDTEDPVLSVGRGFRFHLSAFIVG